MQLVLSLFPGIGLLDMAFEQEGFCVVRGPDVLWGGDIRRFHPPAGKFNGVIGGPPCQAFSRLAHMVRHNGLQPRFGNLIPEFERCVYDSQPDWFLMENVPDAPVPHVDGYETWATLLNNRQLGQIQNRVRRFSFGSPQRTVLMIDTVALEPAKFEYAATHGSREIPVKIGGSGKVKRSVRTGKRVSFEKLCESQGLEATFDITAFTQEAKRQAIGNGVPLPMGRAIARAVKEAIGETQSCPPNCG